MLTVPSERVRELSEDEAERLDRTCATTMRRSSTLPAPPGCGFTSACCAGTRSIGPAARFVKPGKGGKLITARITSDRARNPLAVARASSGVRVHLCAERGNIPDEKLARRPITYGGLQSYWQRLRKRAGVDRLPLP